MLKKERLEIIRKYYPNAITLIDSVIEQLIIMKKSCN